MACGNRHHLLHHENEKVPLLRHENANVHRLHLHLHLGNEETVVLNNSATNEDNLTERSPKAKVPDVYSLGSQRVKNPTGLSQRGPFAFKQ